MKCSAANTWAAVIIIFLCCPWMAGAADYHGESDRHLSRLIETTKPSVVAVGTYYFNDVPKGKYLGTGFSVFNGKKIVTNHHVVEPVIKEKKTAYLRIFHRSFKKQGIKARIAAVDPYHDLALIEHDGPYISPLKISHTKGVKEGYEVMFTGYPVGLVLGLNPTTHKGIVSNIAPLIKPSPTARIIDGEIIRHLSEPYNVYQIDAVAFPGNSGSPVCLVSTGEVIGVINQVFVKGKKEHALTHPTGITYAIPARFIRDLEK